MIKRNKVWFMAAIVIIAMVWILLRTQGNSTAVVGRPAPYFSLPGIDHAQVSLKRYRGKPVMLYFWASWCRPCRDEAPALQTFAQRYGHKITLLGVNLQESADQVSAFVRDMGIAYPVALDRTGKIAAQYGVRAVPSTWVIDQHGVARLNVLGGLRFEDLQDIYRQALGESIDTVTSPDPAQRMYRFYSKKGLYLYDGNEAWQSHDNGVTWAQTSHRPIEVNSAGSVRYIAWAGKSALAWVEGKGLMKTINDGETWQSLGGGVFSVDLPEVALALSRSAKQAWAGSIQGLFGSSDGGRTWEPLPFSLSIHGLTIDPYHEDRLVIATSQGVWSYHTNSKTAALLAASPVRRFDDVGVIKQGLMTFIIAVAPNGDVYRTDALGSWELLNARDR